MLSTNNKSDVKKKERKYSWFTVFAWLYLKTIGRILLKRWNKWAENILYYDKVIGNSGIQTDDLNAVDGSVQINLKPKVAEKKSQTIVISKDGGVQTDRVAFQDVTMQNERVETIDKSVEVDLESEVTEKESATTSEDEESCSEVSSGSTGKDLSNIEVYSESELVWDDYFEVYEDNVKKLNNKLENASQKLERLQSIFLKGENRKLRTKNEELKKSFVELKKDVEDISLKASILNAEKKVNYIKKHANALEKSMETKTNSTPNSFMSYTGSTVRIHSLNSQREVRTDF